MYPAPDMSLWQGRIDSQEGADARRWHQYALAPINSPGLSRVD